MLETDIIRVAEIDATIESGCSDDGNSALASEPY